MPKPFLWTGEMSDVQRPACPEDFLGSCQVIDTEQSSVRMLAHTLATADVIETARRCFEYVRDRIDHSADIQRNPVTCTASSVLAHGTGFCFAKSHLLCALLRASRIPAGLCYQRLSIDGREEPFCLHGLTAVWLPEFGWYRLDSRGNRDGIDAQFEPPVEKLAFSTTLPGECDCPEIHVSPLEVVVATLERCASWSDVCRNLPDAPLKIQSAPEAQHD